MDSAPLAADVTGWAEANRVCAAYHARLETLPRPPTADAMPLFLTRKVDLTRAVARQLRALPARPPAGRQLLAALERRAIAFEQLAIAESEHDDSRAELAILAGQNADRAASRWSRQLDAAACGRTLF